ncbi:MAG: hypothetical protein AB7H96_00395 [Vicinamibacterales bacterium]
MRAVFLVSLSVASLLTVLVSIWWTIDGVLAKWRRGAMRMPNMPGIMRRVPLMTRSND